MYRQDVEAMTYQAYISTIDHIWNRGRNEFYTNLAKEFEISKITGVKLAYLCGLEDYVEEVYNEISTLKPHSICIMDELTYTEGLEVLIEVLGEKKSLLTNESSVFEKY